MISPGRRKRGTCTRRDGLGKEDEENDFDLENVIEFEGGMDELLKDLLTETFNCSLKLTFKKVPNIQGTSKFKVQKVSKIQDAATYIVL